MSAPFPPGPPSDGPEGPTGPRAPRGPQGPRPRRRRGALAPTIAVLGVLVFLLVLFAELWTEVLWFRQLGFLDVLRTRLVTQSLLFLAAAVLMGVAVWASLTVAFRGRPIYAPSTPGQEALDRYREQLEPLRRLVGIAVPLVLALFAGSAAAAQWRNVQLWLNRQSFDETDPVFGLDVGFYVFTLPVLQFLVGFLTAVVLLAGLAALLTHYLYGGLRLSGPGERTTRAARVQLAVLGALFLLLRAASYWLERYALTTSESSDITGPLYTDVNAVIPARTLLAVVSVLVALTFVFTAIRGNWRVPALGVGLLVLVAVAAGGIWPQVIQRFQVQPNELSLQTPYISNNIAATRAAYGLDEIEVTDYDAELSAERGALAQDARTIPGIRLLDPGLVSPTYQQLQQIRQFYAFPDPLDVGQYSVEGELRDTVLAVRELNLNGLPPAQRNWINDHTVYTHGYGVVAAYGNQRTAGGEPVFFQSGIVAPNAEEEVVTETDLGQFQQRIYFGEFSPNYSIVGGPEGVAPQELDYPDSTVDSGQQNVTYDGDGGVPMGDFFTQLLFAIKFRSEEIILSDAVNPESQVMFDRNPRERVEKVAPWLQLDGDPYPAVVGDRVLWVIDGYTTSNRYPYSNSTVLDEATATSTTATADNVTALLPERVNYVRNSVKATVDAYDGEVTLYAWDTEDPVLQAWRGVFPDAVRDVDEISGELMAHVRYPQDIFKVQREVLERYHVTDPASFFNGTDFWSVPDDPTLDEVQALQPPYYLSLQMPGQEEPSFSLSSTFIPTNQGGGEVRNVLTGFLAVDADAGDEEGSPREGYGQLRLLQIRNDETVPGPGQVQNDFNADPLINEQLNILTLGQSDLRSGNLLTLPIGGGLLYVQPVYIQSSGNTSYPLLQRVLVAFGDELGFGETLDEALDDLFGGDAGADAPDADAGALPDTGEVEQPVPDVGDGGGIEDPVPAVSPTPTPDDEGGAPTQEPAPTVGPVDPAAAQQQLDQALQAARQAITDSQAALADGDFAAYGEAQDRLEQAIERAIAAEAVLEGGR
ncbi:UPF0182 family membrane protein [Aquipuribacter sp. SD81]|uniref:UPF0182 family membrane protein n=1 Tax=Aquipuribacter sp. SD81 TaxID=3127703 RepID=UPI00301A7274